MVSICITQWDDGVAWTNLAGYHPRDLERRLVLLTGMGRGEVKRLARQLRNRDCITLPLRGADNCYAADSLRSFLESLGAAVTVQDV